MLEVTVTDGTVDISEDGVKVGSIFIGILKPEDVEIVGHEIFVHNGALTTVYSPEGYQRRTQ